MTDLRKSRTVDLARIVEALPIEWITSTRRPTEIRGRFMDCFHMGKGSLEPDELEALREIAFGTGAVKPQAIAVADRMAQLLAKAVRADHLERTAPQPSKGVTRAVLVAPPKEAS